MQQKSKIALIVGIVMWVGFNSAWLFFGRETFEIGQAFIIYACSFILIFEFKSKLTQSFQAISLNHLLDELFFDPTKISWNEYLTVAFILLRIYIPISLTGLANTLILKIRRK